MKRNAINSFIDWKNSNETKPLLLTGTKGVGKTYLAYDFAKAFFTHIYYINFEYSQDSQSLFHTKDSTENSRERLRTYLNVDDDFEEESSILILDEISFLKLELPLLTLNQMTGFRYIIMISSVSIWKQYNDCKQVSLYPLSFDEFLKAISKDWYLDVIIQHYNENRKIPDIVHKELLELYYLYLKIGGMPSVINEFINFSSEINAKEQHEILFGSFEKYVINHNSETDALKINQVIDSMALQLIKENRKFQYKLIRKGTTYSMYKDAIDYLTREQLAIRCNKITSEQLNNMDLQINRGELANQNFKLYYPDTGIFQTKLNQLNNYNRGNTYLSLHENYVAQSLTSRGYPLVFWESDSIAKIDFIIPKGIDIIPIELHIGTDTRSKSISVLKQKSNFPYAIKISEKNFEYGNDIKYIPYYAVFCI